MKKHCGVEKLESRQPHKLETACSSQVAATKFYSHPSGVCLTKRQFNSVAVTRLVAGNDQPTSHRR